MLSNQRRVIKQQSIMLRQERLTWETKSTVAQVPGPTAKRRVMRLFVSSKPDKSSVLDQELRATGVLGGITSQSELAATAVRTTVQRIAINLPKKTIFGSFLKF